MGYFEDLMGQSNVSVGGSLNVQAALDFLRLLNPAEYERVKAQDPRYQAEQAAATAPPPPPPEAPPENAPPPLPPSPPEPPAYSGPTARQKLEALLPPGFDVTALPDTFTSPFVSGAQTGAKQSAQGFIANMLRRQTITPEGAEKASAALGTQDPAVTRKLADLANTMVAGERSKLRGIAKEGYAAADAPGETGEFFNAAPYQQRVQSEAARYQGDFPGAFTTGAKDIAYDVTGLPAAGGAVTNPANVSFDPYAVAGGSLRTGTEDETSKQYGQKKRTTSVF